MDIKKTVVFIYYPDNPTNASPDGTGFLVGVRGVNNTNFLFGYLVTARHVLWPTTNYWLPGIVVRINCRDGTSISIPISLSTSGPKKNVFTDDDPTVDIAVVPFYPQLGTNFGNLYLPINLIPSENDFKNLYIHEGSDVFFTGMFSRHLGVKQNTPIARFGKVALMTDEKIDWVFGPTDLYLIEANSYPGNSGSPVFFQIGDLRGNGSIVLGGPQIMLAGVMSGCFNDIQPLQTLSISTNQYVTPNMGIAGVVPSYELKDILFSQELQELRSRFDQN